MKTNIVDKLIKKIENEEINDEETLLEELEVISDLIQNVDEKLNLGDISKINEKKLSKDIDLLFYGFPCTDISKCGKKNGFFNE